jgi:hypothetical protein
MLKSVQYSFPGSAAHTEFPFTEFARSFDYQRCVAQGSTMVVTFLLPPPRPPDSSGGASLPTIQERHVYRDKPSNHSQPQGVALAGKIFQHGGGSTNGSNNEISKNGLETTITRRNTTSVSQDLCLVINLMQQMASNRTEFLEKFLKKQEKQARRARRAAREAEKVASNMLSLMRNFSTVLSPGRRHKKKASASKLTTSTYNIAAPSVPPFTNQSVNVPHQVDSTHNKSSTAGQSNIHGDNNKVCTPEMCSTNPLLASTSNQALPPYHPSDRKTSQVTLNNEQPKRTSKCTSECDQSNNESTNGNVLPSNNDDINDNTSTNGLIPSCNLNAEPPESDTKIQDSSSSSPTHEVHVSNINSIKVKNPASNRNYEKKEYLKIKIKHLTTPTVQVPSAHQSCFPSFNPRLLCSLLSDVRASSFALPRNHPLSQIYWFNLFPDHPG